MIKTPKIGQTVYYVMECRIFKDIVHLIYPDVVQFKSFLWSNKYFLFKTEKEAIQYVLKVYNKQILALSQKRENLASRLAKIMGDKPTTSKLPKLPKTWGIVNGQKF